MQVMSMPYSSISHITGGDFGAEASRHQHHPGLLVKIELRPTLIRERDLTITFLQEVREGLADVFGRPFLVGLGIPELTVVVLDVFGS